MSNDFTNNQSYYDEIQNYISDIETKNSFTVNFYLIDSISTNYQKSLFFFTYKDIVMFTDELAINLENTYGLDLTNSIIIVVSVLDKKTSIRTGDNVKYKLSDSNVKKVLKYSQSYFYIGYYLIGLSNMLYKIHSFTNYEFDLFLFFLGVIGGIILFLIKHPKLFYHLISFWYPEVYHDEYQILHDDENPTNNNYNNLNSELVLKMDKIKGLGKDLNINREKYLQDTCIICLQEYKNNFSTVLTEKLNDDEINNIDNPEIDNQNEILGKKNFISISDTIKNESKFFLI